MEIRYRWGALEGLVHVELGLNEDPAALGCADFARGFPYCRATAEPEAIGYGNVLYWLQLVDHSHGTTEFELDPFAPLGPPSHPFAFYGWAPTLFDAPHSDLGDWDFHAHTFLCGLGGELMELRREARAILGFGWGFSKQGEKIEPFGPTPLAAEDWEGHREYLGRSFPEWSFAPGFFEHPLRP